MTEKITDVAVAIFLRPDGTFLLSSRPEGKPYSGYWEFPGGKIEPGESVQDALVRELIEELNVTITVSHPWFTFLMRYTHATVRLHCWRVLAWTGEMHGMEGQAFAWQSIDAIEVTPTLPGCVPIFRALALPQTMWISNAAALGTSAWLAALESALDRLDRVGAPMIQVREKSMEGAALQDFATRVIRLARPRGAKVLINGDIDLARAVGADGVHLPASQIAALKVRPDLPLVGASTHSRDEILRAAERGCDYCVLGPVKETPSHPGQPGIGWSRFAQLALDAPVPVLGIGGLNEAERGDSIAAGAHGLAMLRSATHE